MKHFVLVHRICHGAWCWYRVVSLLKSAGHRVTPLDLGASGINPKKITELTSISDYVQPLMEFMAALPPEQKVILVGHSFGGIGISLAMESYPEKVIAGVYVTSFMPNHHSPPAIGMEEFFKRVMADSIMDSQLSFNDGPDNPPTDAMFGPEFTEARVYHLSPKDDIELAKTCLRPGKWFLKDLSNESLLTKEKFGSVNRVYIVCKDDLLIKESLQRWNINEYGPADVKVIEDDLLIKESLKRWNINEYGPADVKVIEGADHMPMFSKPKELCHYLGEIAEKFD